MSEVPDQPYPTVVIVGDADPLFASANSYLERKLREHGLQIALVPEVKLWDYLARTAVEREQDAEAGGVLLLGPGLLGPLPGLEEFLNLCVGDGVFALAPLDEGNDPLRTVLPLLYVGAKPLRGMVPRARRHHERAIAWPAALQRAAVESAVWVNYFFEYAETSADKEDGRLFLRDGLPLIPEKACPFVPWAAFTASPLALDKWAVHAPAVCDYVLNSGYPEGLFWDTLIPAAPPETWYFSTGQHRILPVNPRAKSDPSILPMAVLSVQNLSNMRSLVLTLIESGPLSHLHIVYPGDVTDSCVVWKQLEPVLGAPEDRSHVSIHPAPLAEITNGTAAFLGVGEVWGASGGEEDGVVLLINDSEAILMDSGGKSRDSDIGNLVAGEEYRRRILGLFESKKRLGLAFPLDSAGGVPARLERVSIFGRKQLGVLERTLPLHAAGQPGYVRPFHNMCYARVNALRPLRELLTSGGGHAQGTALTAADVSNLIAASAFGSGFFATGVQTPNSAALQSLLASYRLDSLSRYLHPEPQKAATILKSRVSKKRRRQDVIGNWIRGER